VILPRGFAVHGTAMALKYFPGIRASAHMSLRPG
jgi:hypothetical protein